jgi:hypothetical protein
MKIKLIPTVFALLLVAVLLMLTYRNDMPADGYQLIGFPSYFYKNTSAKLIDTSIGRTWV